MAPAAVLAEQRTHALWRLMCVRLDGEEQEVCRWSPTELHFKPRKRHMSPMKLAHESKLKASSEWRQFRQVKVARRVGNGNERASGKWRQQRSESSCHVGAASLLVQVDQRRAMAKAKSEMIEATSGKRRRRRRRRKVFNLKTEGSKEEEELKEENKAAKRISLVGTNFKLYPEAKFKPAQLAGMLSTITLLLVFATCYGLVVASLSQPASRWRSHGEPLKLGGEGGGAGNPYAALVRQRRRTAQAGGRPEAEVVFTAGGRGSGGQPVLRRPSSGGAANLNAPATERGELANVAPESAVGATLSRPPSVIKNVTAQNGQSVFLHCQVEPSADTAVSWFRGAGELQLLTYESSTIIKDDRFVVRHGITPEHPNDWALLIKNLDKNTDSGLYQCQTSSEPPQSQYYQLNVVEPQVHILGAPDMAVKLGAAINLTCVITPAPEPMQFIFWYRDERMINYDMNERGKIVMAKWAQKPESVASNLQIFSSKLSDSGNYTCMPSGARPMSIYVHVLEGQLDKRLIMFQNDNYNDPSSAASSQQTNSAISVHMVRLSRGRAYAFFVAFLIFASWFQLVAQAQTAISLILLAIIGLFLGKVTEGQAGGRGHSEKEGRSSGSKLETETLGALRSPTEPGRRKPPRRGRQPRSPSSASSSGNKELESVGDSPRSQSTGATMDPLIRRANSALDLLRSISSSASESSCAEKQKCHSPSRRAIELAPIQVGKLASRGQTSDGRHHKEEPASPSSASSASTGYNSDTRSATNPPTDSASSPAARLTCLGGPDQMIELASQPTALRLIMDEFSERRVAAAAARSATPVEAAAAPITATIRNESAASPSLSASTCAPNNNNNNTNASAEPYYSAPVFLGPPKRRNSDGRRET